MEFEERQFSRQARRRTSFVIVGVLGALMLTLAGPAQAKQILGTKGPDKLRGTSTGDLIKAGRGNDAIRGRGGKDRIFGGRGADRLFGGRGADRLNAVDGRRDRLVRGGPGKDVCRIDAADRSRTKGCETVKVAKGPGPGPTPSPGPGPVPGPGTGTGCVNPPPDAMAVAGPLRPAGDPPPTFSDAFYGALITINASVDGMTGDELPISIEEVCDVPQGLESDAAQLIGGEGVGIVSSSTGVFDATGQRLTGDAATTALAGADSLSVRARLLRPGQWRLDEDGTAVPTFGIARADITD
jgi:hypothetical protein